MFRNVARSLISGYCYNAKTLLVSRPVLSGSNGVAMWLLGFKKLFRVVARALLSS